MQKLNETNQASAKPVNREVVWLIVGIPIGCGVGAAFGNLALGVGYGMLLGATIMVFRMKKNGHPVSPIVKIGLIAILVAVPAVWALVIKK